MANHSVVAGCGGDNGPVEPSGLSLVRAGPGQVVTGKGYFAVWRPDSRKLPRIEALVAWLVKAAETEGCTDDCEEAA